MSATLVVLSAINLSTIPYKSEVLCIHHEERSENPEVDF